MIESGYVGRHDVAGSYHQDGIQAMGGTRLTFRGLSIDRLRNANMFVNFGGKKVSMPTDVICDRCVRAELGSNGVRRDVDSLRHPELDDLHRPLPRSASGRGLMRT